MPPLCPDGDESALMLFNVSRLRIDSMALAARRGELYRIAKIFQPIFFAVSGSHPWCYINNGHTAEIGIGIFCAQFGTSERLSPAKLIVVGRGRCYGNL